MPGYEACQLPTLCSLSANPLVQNVVDFIGIPYFAVELPLHLLELNGADDYVCFENSNTVRPFFVFLFWALVALAILPAMARSNRVQ